MSPTAGEERALGGGHRGRWSPLQWQHIMKDAAPELSPSPSTPPPSPASVVSGQAAAAAAAARTYDEKFFRVRGFRSIEVTEGASSAAAMREPPVPPSSRSDSIRSAASTTSSHRTALSSSSITSRASAPATSPTAISLENGALSALKTPVAHAAAVSSGPKKQVSFRLRGRRSASSNRPKPKGTPAQRLSRSASTPSLLRSKPGAQADTPAQRPYRAPIPPLPPSLTSSTPGKGANNLVPRVHRSGSSSSETSKQAGVPPPPPYRPREPSSSSPQSIRHAPIPAPAQRPGQSASSSALSPSSSAAGHAFMVVEEISPRAVEEGIPPVTAVDRGDKSCDQLRQERPSSPVESSFPGEDDASMVVTMGVADSILGKLSRRGIAPSPFSYGFKGMFAEGIDAPPAASPTPPRHKKKYAEVVDQHDSEVVGQQDKKPSSDAADFRSVKWRESPKEEAVVCPGCLRYVGKGSHGSISNSSNSSNSSNGNGYSRSGYRRGGHYSSDEDSL